jgi:CRP/FNR family transcriptional regulator, cyclic AMP receptor protein
MFDVREVLRIHPIFAAAPDVALDTLARACRERTLAPKEILYRAGDPAACAFVLVDGLVRVYQKTPDGREVTVTTLVAPNAFGEKTVIAEDAGAPKLGYPENTMSIRSTRLIEIPGPALLAFLREAHASAFELLRDVCCRFAASARREVDVMLPVPVRLASLLLSYADAAGTASDDGVVIKLALTHDDLANGLGVATKSIARTLREWTADEVIARRKGWFVIHKREVLESLCGELRLNHVYRYAPGK